MAKGKVQMTNRKRSKLPITRSEDLSVTSSKSPDQPVPTSPDWNPLTPLELLQALVEKAIRVLPYQDRWIRDDSPLKVAVWSRQSGKSFAAALRAVIKCLEKRTQYIILSKGERQSRMFMEKVKDFCLYFKRLKALPAFSEFESDDKTMEVHFPHNGSRIIGLPANPDTARGYSGNIVLDEFAFHGDAHKIYAACFPIITRGYSIEVISTPNGTAGKFYEIAKQAGLVSAYSSQLTANSFKPSTQHPAPSPQLWSGHRVDIYDAVNQGLPANLQLLRSGCDDEETWLQEYCCRFLSDAQNYIPVELISSCVHEEATTEWGPGSGNWGLGKEKPQYPAPSTQHPELYLGVDIGRKHDLTIAWLFEKVGGVLWSRHLLTLKGVSFDEQEKAICRLIEGGAFVARLSPAARAGGDSRATRGIAAIRRCCIDQSGLGMMLAEHLVQKYGEVVEPVQFTAALKERLAPMVKMAFEERTVRIPDNREVRADLNSVKRFVTPAGNVRFDAEHTDRGHADRFWALALVVNAASQPTASFSEQAFLAGEPVMHGFAEVVL
jgi:phage FluMu gp28-like protein